MVISGGANDRPAPKRANGTLAAAAALTGSIAAEVRMIPNQALTFTGDVDGLSALVILFGKGRKIEDQEDQTQE